jgi:hypothetical protein
VAIIPANRSVCSALLPPVFLRGKVIIKVVSSCSNPQSQIAIMLSDGGIFKGKVLRSIHGAAENGKNLAQRKID